MLSYTCISTKGYNMNNIVKIGLLSGFITGIGSQLPWMLFLFS